MATSNHFGSISSNIQRFEEMIVVRVRETVDGHASLSRDNQSDVVWSWAILARHTIKVGELEPRIRTNQGRLRGLAVACWTTDPYYPCSNLGVGISEGCFIFDFASLPLEVYTGSRSATYDLRNFLNLPAARLKYDYNIVSTQYIIRKDEDVQSIVGTQAERIFSGISEGEVDSKVNELIQFLLIMDQKKMPIKRQDINKYVLKEHSRAFNKFIEKAGKKLKSIFGIELMDISGDKKKSYCLINTMETDVDDPHVVWSPDDNARLGLVMVILSTIFMSGNTITDCKLYSMLKMLGVDVEMTHEVFGDVKKFISQDLVRQGYLLHERLGLSDPPVYEYKWGPRAKYETSKRNILDFVCQVYGDTDPSKWTSQWQDVQRTEEMAANNDNT
ncbi:hypothetical protein LSH36_486g06051 [Paralvinella palmiformis]|uniref:MAGE domain-containing protein n=1 Tax=Paralvinella palmiformis TaxID=53620 RepID=A0AAD9MWV2_9ANNE|nr:hypothetical protein LSH36_486g06051 [Paralvinella palmiformis]